MRSARLPDVSQQPWEMKTIAAPSKSLWSGYICVAKLDTARLFVYYVFPASGRLTNQYHSTKTRHARTFVTSTVRDGTCDLIPRPPNNGGF